MADCKNISSRRYPFFATRKGREKVEDYDDVTAITAWNGLVVVSGTDLYYKGEKVGEVTAGEKQFACITTQIVIMPDKKCLDTRTKELIDLAVSVEINASISTTAPGDEDTEQAMTITGDFTSNFAKFNEGDVLHVTLDTDKFELMYEKAELSSGNTVVTFATGATGNFESKTYSSGETERKVPDFDYICEANNRIWGCVSDEQTIYASALGDPTRYYEFQGKETDSWAQPVSSAGEFTGCHKLGSTVLFFKEDTLHKIMGDYPSAYQVYSYSMDGVKRGCYKSLQVVNEMLIYMSRHGVCMYTGGSASYISDALGKKSYENGVAGVDGEHYFLSCKDDGNNQHLFVFDMKNNMWLREDNTKAVDFANDGGMVYMVSGGSLYILNEGDFEEDWYIQFNPIYESAKEKTKQFNKKHYVKLIIRAEVKKGHFATVMSRCDGGRWIEAGKIVGESNEMISLNFAINRCDKFEIRLEGTGEFTLMNMARIYTTGSER